MGFTYRLSRRLAQAHLVLLPLFALACNDLDAPSTDAPEIADSTSIQSNADSLPLSQVVTSNAACTNQPAGLTVITDNPWNVKPPYSLPEGGSLDWRTYNGSGRVSILSDAGAPRSSAPIIEGRFPTGHPGGSAPFNVGIMFRRVKTLYWCVWQKLSPNFTNNGNTGTKWGFIRTPYGSGSTQRLNHYFNLATRIGINLQFSSGGQNRNMRGNFDMIANAGNWQLVEFLVIANTSGNSNGVARIWVNGNKVLDQTDVQYFLPGQAPAFTGISWSPTYGGGSNPVPYNMWQKVDHWLISGKV